MIIKEQDSANTDIANLESLLALPDLTAQQKLKLTDELSLVRARHKEKQRNAVVLDRYVKNHPHRVIIHDLRLEHDDQVAVIDHLLINRSLQIYVIIRFDVEGDLKISDDGLFQLNVGKFYRSIESPLERATAAAETLNTLINDAELLPKRLGMRLTADCIPVVMLGKDCRVHPADGFDMSHVLTIDNFYEKYCTIADAEVPLREAVNVVFRTMKKEGIIALGEALVARHAPETVDYAEKFSVKLPEDKPEEKPAKAPLEDISRTAQEPALALVKPRETKMGFCIQCRRSTEFCLESPLCKKCRSQLEKGKSFESDETFCHDCGHIEPDRSIAAPCCSTCAPDDADENCPEEAMA